LRFENRVLRNIFGPKRDEVTRGWRNLCSQELLDLYSLPSIIIKIESKRMRLAGHVKGKRPLRRARCRWVDTVKMDPR
jgi:hypothetical protein